MTDETLPDPLVPAEVDLRGFSGFMLDVDRLLASELVAIGTPEECWAAMMLWCRAWKQSPPASLPNDERVLRAFSGAGSKWAKVREVALRGFVLCSDGRLYHRVLSEEANEAWRRRVRFKERSAKANERRWAETRHGHEHGEGKAGGKEPKDHPRDVRQGLQQGLQQAIQDGIQQAAHKDSLDPPVDRTGTGTGTGTVKPKSKTAEPPSADAARTPRSTDPVKDEIWRTGKAILEAEGMTRDRAGSYLGRLCKDFGNLLVLQAVRDCQAAPPAKPSEWLMARCQERRSRAGETLAERNARAVADWVPPEMRDAAN